MRQKAFSLIEMMIAVMLLSVAMVGLVGAITWSAVNVSIQTEKAKAVGIAALVLEEMEGMGLEDIINRDWDKWVKDNGYDFGLPNLQVQVNFPLVYDEEKNGSAYTWGYTYRWGVIWGGYYRPLEAKSLLEVDLTLNWTHRMRPARYEVSTILSEISGGTG